MSAFMDGFESLEARKLFAVQPVVLPSDLTMQSDLSVAPAAQYSLSASPSSVSTILNNGAVSNRVDVVLVGDGFTTQDLPQFHRDAQNFVDHFFDQAPLGSYKSYFNVHRVDVVSEESGVSGDPSEGVTRITPMQMSYFGSGVERLLTVDVDAALTYSKLAPDVQQTIAVANSSKYGGAGYGQSDVLTIAGQNLATLEIARHEFGHSFANLADEYSYDGPPQYAGDEPYEPNVTTLTAAKMLANREKWYRWLGTQGVGAYEGGYYSQTGIYRPTQNSKMRQLGQPYGPVNSEQIILELYREVRPIDSASPGGTYNQNGVLSVVPLKPNDHLLSVQWFLDANAIPGATANTFYISSLPAMAGNHTISVKVTDNTSMVRDEDLRATLMTQQKSWGVYVAPSSVRGRIYSDLNLNGSSEASEPGIVGLRVYVDGNRNGILDAGEIVTTTDSQGNYKFASLPAGRYCVREVVPAGFRPMYPGNGARDVTVGVGQIVDNQNIGNTRNVLVSGSVFNDANRDRIRQTSEAGLGAWRVFVDLNNDGIFQSAEPSKITDSSGAYAFQGLAAGTYTVRVVAQSGWTLLSPTSTFKLTLSSGAQAMDRNFALAR